VEDRDKWWNSPERLRSFERSQERKANESRSTRFAPLIVFFVGALGLVAFVYFIFLVLVPVLGSVLLFLSEFFSFNDSPTIDTGICDQRTMTGDC
jgi:fatty acid desaturase